MDSKMEYSDKVAQYAKTCMTEDFSLSDYAVGNGSTTLPVSDDSGRIHGTYDIYGLIVPGHVFGKETFMEPFVPDVLIKNRKKIEFRLRVYDLCRELPKTNLIFRKISFLWNVCKIWLNINFFKK